MGESPEGNNDLPGMAESYWVATSPETAFPPLDGAGRADVTVIGGGIAGITTAFLLKRAGLTVALIDAYRIITGATGHTTAKITSLHRLIYTGLIDRFGSGKARQYADANQAAIEAIASLVREYAIPCSFERKPAYTFAESVDDRERVAAEADAAKSLGLSAAFTEEVGLPGETHGAVVLENQAQFHPRNYLLLLAGHLPGEGSYIFEMTRAVDIKEQDGGVTVRTDRGSLHSGYAVLATHYPIYDIPGAYFARMRPSRSYALALRTDEPFPDGIFINAAGPVHSWRSQPAGGGEIAIVTGAAHDTGKVTDTRAHYRSLEAYARSVYPVRAVDYRWSAQDYITADGVPYIGPLAPGHDRVFVATGFGKWGMTNGTAAGMILADLIRGRTNPWAEVFDPARFGGESAPPAGVREALRSAGGTVVAGADRIAREAAAIPPREGKVVEVGGQKVAVYRDGRGTLHTLDPTCMHMACTVAWNNAEESWDCPCHGSRYDARGRVIESPTVKDLVQKEVVRR
ncbi:FAD-dependent oxidoreductase [Methanoculleus sp. 10]|uniref:FAD-dependent oxidoreductase n=1 Tax=Methanoculleus sp. 10 TaxID=430615 RepID=UPI0025EBE10D|nr:FAD-dependent oxidoreductase [Methanoculleus sp. 10]